MEEPPTVMFDPVGEFKKALDGVVSDEDPEGCVPCPLCGADGRAAGTS